MSQKEEILKKMPHSADIEADRIYCEEYVLEAMQIYSDEQNEKLRKLVEVQEKYIKFLSDYVTGLTGFLMVHTMLPDKETTDKGQKLRAEIAKLKSELE